MQPETRKNLFDAMEAIAAIQSFTSSLDSADYLGNDLVQAAVERKFEIIGEALNRIQRTEPELLERISNSHRIIGFRNILAHGYDVIDQEIVWDVISNYLPTLRSDVDQLLSD